MDKQLEMTAELRKARNWILAVGVIMFVTNLITVNLIFGDRLTPEAK